MGGFVLTLLRVRSQKARRPEVFVKQFGQLGNNNSNLKKTKIIKAFQIDRCVSCSYHCLNLQRHASSIILLLNKPFYAKKNANNSRKRLTL